MREISTRTVPLIADANQRVGGSEPMWRVCDCRETVGGGSGGRTDEGTPTEAEGFRSMMQPLSPTVPLFPGNESGPQEMIHFLFDPIPCSRAADPRPFLAFVVGPTSGRTHSNGKGGS